MNTPTNPTIKTLATETCKAIAFALALYAWIYLAAVIAALTVGV